MVEIRFTHAQIFVFVFAVFIMAPVSRWNRRFCYVLRPSISRPILGTTISDTERELFALPIRNGGLGILKLTEKAANEYEISRIITAPLVAIIAIQGDTLPDIMNHNVTKAKILQQKQQHLKQKIEIVDEKLSSETLRVLDQTRSQEHQTG